MPRTVEDLEAVCPLQDFEVDKFVNEPAAMNPSILLVDDNPGAIQLMGRLMSGLAQLRFATSGAVALEQMKHAPPDLVLLDAEMPGMSGYQLCEAMKAQPALAHVPVIFVTAHSGPQFELKCFELGAVDFIAKPISEPLLLARVKTQLRIKRLTDELRSIATIDALTELRNRRTFEDLLQVEWRRCLRAGEPIGLLMVDVDHFKMFNDCYGHPAGDGCLRSVAQVLAAVTQRPGDVAARYGGEEFALLLPNTPRAGAEHLAQRLLDAVEQLGMPHEASPTASHVTVSVGLGCYDGDSACWIDPSPDSRFASSPPFTAADLVGSADKALYSAKRAGRAQAWRLDIDDVDAPSLARQIAPPHRRSAARVSA